MRYDTFLENYSQSDSRQTNYTAGVVWQPVKYLRCQLNYTYEDYASRARVNRNVVSLMFTGIF
ncbi:MAG: porin [Alistipes shahii]